MSTKKKLLGLDILASLAMFGTCAFRVLGKENRDLDLLG